MTVSKVLTLELNPFVDFSFLTLVLSWYSLWFTWMYVGASGCARLKARRRICGAVSQLLPFGEGLDLSRCRSILSGNRHAT